MLANRNGAATASVNITPMIVMTVLAMIGFLVTSASAWAQPSTTALVVVDKVTQLDTAPRTWTPGTVLSHTDAQLGSEVAGLVTWVVDVGTKLEAGETVARFNSELLQLSLDDSEAAVRGLEKRLIYLRQEAKRLTSLASVSSAAQSQLDRSIADRDVAVEQLTQAQALAASNRYRLRQANVVAPFNGQIVERLVVEGEYVAVGRAIVRMVDLNRVEVRSQAPLRVAPFVQAGMMVPIRYNGSIEEVAVSAVIPVGDLASRTFEVRLKLNEQKWVIGTSVQVGLPTSLSKRILTVSRDALVLRESGPFVFVVEGDRVRKVAVETGIGAAARIELVDSSLQVDDLVVIAGAELLRDGQSVSWRE